MGAPIGNKNAAGSRGGAKRSKSVSRKKRPAQKSLKQMRADKMLTSLRTRAQAASGENRRRLMIAYSKAWANTRKKR